MALQRLVCARQLRKHRPHEWVVLGCDLFAGCDERALGVDDTDLHLSSLGLLVSNHLSERRAEFSEGDAHRDDTEQSTVSADLVGTDRVRDDHTWCGR